MTQVYLNPSKEDPQEQIKEGEDKPIEVSYKFPKRDLDVIAGMKVTVGDKTIEA